MRKVPTTPSVTTECHLREVVHVAGGRSNMTIVVEDHERLIVELADKRLWIDASDDAVCVRVESVIANLTQGEEK